MAQWIRRLTTDQEIAGSNPAGIECRLFCKLYPNFERRGKFCLFLWSIFKRFAKSNDTNVVDEMTNVTFFSYFNVGRGIV